MKLNETFYLNLVFLSAQTDSATHASLRGTKGAILGRPCSQGITAACMEAGRALLGPNPEVHNGRG